MSQINIVNLTPRERQIALLIADGLSNREIAQALGIAESTVKNHCTAIYSKWQVDDRVQAVIIVFALGWKRPYEAYLAMVGRAE